MGCPGVPLKVSEQDILNAINKTHGVIRKAAIELGISHCAFYQEFYKYPHLKPILDQLRNARKDLLVDTAEDVLEYAMEVKEKDLTNALKAGMYYLNTKGKERGYNSISQLLDEVKGDTYKMLKEVAQGVKANAEQKVDDTQS